jgi:hypothetical protein
MVQVNMAKAEKYNFADFTLNNYRNLLKLAKQKFIFRSYTNFDRDENFVIWRHDIDISAHCAYKLARIEAEEEIQTTYCLYIHSKFYNVFEYEITNLLKKIYDLGHHIGLHFCTDDYKLENSDLMVHYLIREKRILEELFGCEINIFSFHNPTPLAIQCDGWDYGGMINAYAGYFRKNVGYCSDSNGYWRFRRLEEVLLQSEDKRLQVLTHPVWWQEKAMSPKERVGRAIEGRSEKNKKQYKFLLTKFERKNIDETR